MVYSVPLPERGSNLWLVWLMVVLHVILVVASLAFVIILAVMDTRNAPKHESSDIKMVNALTVLLCLYGVLGFITFIRLSAFWGRCLAAVSVLMLLLFFMTVLTQIYRSILCGVRIGREGEFVVTFNESRIKDCDWDYSPCVLSFNASDWSTCPSVMHFWGNIKTMERDELTGPLSNSLVGGGICYNAFVLVVMLLSLSFSMLIGIEEAAVMPPAAGFRFSSSSSSSLYSSSFSRVPINDII